MATLPLLEQAIAAHGGRERFNALQQVRVRVEHLGGMIPWLTGLGKSYPQPAEFQVDFRSGRVSFLRYPNEHSVTVYQRGGVSCDGREIPDYRRRFDGWSKRRRWDPSDAAYFFGYAFWDYLTIPYSLENASITEASNDCIVRVQPEGTDSHSAVQRFYFDRSGRLARHDYRADVIGRIFTGAHLSTDYAEHTPILFAQTRRVYARVRALRTPVSVLDARLRVVSWECSEYEH